MSSKDEIKDPKQKIKELFWNNIVGVAFILLVVVLVIWGLLEGGTYGNYLYSGDDFSICATDDAKVGKRYKHNGRGNRYLVVDNKMLRDRISKGKDISRVVTTKVTDMSFLFYNAYFEGNDNFWHWIRDWDVSNVRNMRSMFARSNFNHPIGNWDVSSVTNMSYMFSGATNFNQDLSDWDVSNVREMTGMFAEANSFNQDISNWDVSKVTDMERMFVFARDFNQDLSDWDVSNVVNFDLMFWETKSLNRRPYWAR